MNAIDVERAYVPSIGFDSALAQRAALNERMHARCAFEDLPYGPTPSQHVDVYRPARANGTFALYFHGGYWRSGTRRDSAYVAGPLLDAGVTAYIAGYDLAPAVSLMEIVAQARRCRDAVVADATQHGLDARRCVVIGSSAGANLCARLLLDGDEAWLAPPSAALITGVYDLEPVLATSVNDALRLTPREVRDFSPLHRTERFNARAAIVAVGGDETPEWIDGVRRFADRLERDVSVRYLVVAGENHFSISGSLGIADHPLTVAVLDLFEKP